MDGAHDGVQDVHQRFAPGNHALDAGQGFQQALAFPQRREEFRVHIGLAFAPGAQPAFGFQGAAHGVAHFDRPGHSGDQGALRFVEFAISFDEQLALQGSADGYGVAGQPAPFRPVGVAGVVAAGQDVAGLHDGDAVGGQGLRELLDRREQHLLWLWQIHYRGEEVRDRRGGPSVRSAGGRGSSRGGGTVRHVGDIGTGEPK